MTSTLLRLAAVLAAGALFGPAAADAKNDRGRGDGDRHGRPAWAGRPAQDAAQPGGRRAAAEEPVVEPSPEAPVEEPAPVVAPAPDPDLAPVARSPRRRGHGRAKPRTFVFAGRAVAVDAVAGTVDVRVRKGNSRGRRFRGAVVTFDVRDARIDAVEADGVDGLTAGDVLVGDAVIVQARLAEGTRPDGTAIAARKLIDLVDRDPFTATPAPEAPVAGAPAA